MKFDSLDEVRAAGFEGFKVANDLRASKLSEVPSIAGVYMVVRDPARPPAFANKSCGGHFKGKDPSVSTATLGSNWISESAVLYIGKAGGGTSSATLRERLKSYLRFGSGAPVGHWGGRFIWQIENANAELSFCWRPTSGGEDAIVVEKRLIQEFVTQFGARPFANLQG